MASSHTTRTLERLRKNGCVVDVCEKWIPNPKHPGGGFRRDLFGLFDIVALVKGKIIGIQSTGVANRSAHLKKMLGPELQSKLAAWANAGGGIELWAWEKKKNRWQPRIQTIEWEPCGPVAGSKIMAAISEDVPAKEEWRGDDGEAVEYETKCADCGSPLLDPSAKFTWTTTKFGELQELCSSCNSKRLSKP